MDEEVEARRFRVLFVSFHGRIERRKEKAIEKGIMRKKDITFHFPFHIFLSEHWRFGRKEES